jgi:hypothetical protein
MLLHFLDHYEKRDKMANPFITGEIEILTSKVRGGVVRHNLQH